MKSFSFSSFDETKLYVKHWSSLQEASRGLILIAHGLCETADYYDDFSAEAIKQGFDVVVPEARGHGRTAGDINSPDYPSIAGNPGKDSLNNMAKDLFALTQFIQKDQQKRPVFLLGHSMGAIVAQLYAMKYSKHLFGLILTGLPRIENTDHLLKVVNEEIIAFGLKSPCKKTFNEMFSMVNAPFEPVKTDLDWITSDEDMISESLVLPTTLVSFNNEFYRDFLLSYLETNKIENWKENSRTLPIFLLGGGMDVVGSFGKSIEDKYHMLKSAGIEEVNFKIYDGLRHSILREKKRKEVIKDIMEWIEFQLLRCSTPCK